MTVKRAVLYARVSDDDRRYMTSGIENQLNDCRQYALARGYEVVGEYFEDPNRLTSGADWLPEIERVLELAERGGFDVLIVRELDRLARDRVKHVLIKHHLEGVGVAIEYVIGQFAQTDEGEFQEGVMREFAHYQRKQLTRKLHRGIRDHVRAGNIKTGGAGVPYGYNLVKESGNSFLVIDEYEAGVVRLIFDLYANGRKTITGLAEYLDEQKIPLPQKGAAQTRNVRPGLGRWRVSTLATILTNEVYIGRWYYGKKRRVKDHKTGKTRLVSRPKSEWILVEVPAIVDNEIFQAAQAQKERSKRQRGKQHKRLYTLGGMLRCGLCGKHMTNMTQKDHKRGKTYSYAYTVCNARLHTKDYGYKCENGYTRSDLIETAVWSWVKEILLDPARLQAELANYQKRQEEGLRPFLALIESSQAKLAELEKRKARLIEAYTAGVLTLDEIAGQKVEIERQMRETDQAIAQLRADLDPKLLSEADVATITRYSEGIREGAELADSDRALQREIFQHLDMLVTVTAETDTPLALDIQCYLGHSRLLASSGTGSCKDCSKSLWPPAVLDACPAR